LETKQDTTRRLRGVSILLSKMLKEVAGVKRMIEFWSGFIWGATTTLICLLIGFEMGRRVVKKRRRARK